EAAAAHGPKAAPDRRWGNFHVELERARLLGRDGREQSVFDPEDAMEIAMDWVAKRPVESAEFCVQLFRGDGTIVYETNSTADGVAPVALSGRGTARCRIERLGFL